VEYVLIGSIAMAAQGLVRATRGAFSYETLEWEEIVLDGIRIRVATPAMLYRMKRDTVRPQDRLDAETLRREFGLEEDR